MSNQTRAQDVQGAPVNGGRYASPAHGTDDSVVLPGTDVEAPKYDELLAQSWDMHRQMDELKEARNEVLLQASILRAREQFPDATELRLGYRKRTPHSASMMGVTSIIRGDGTREEAGDGTIHTDNWQSERSDAGNLSVDLGIVMMDGISALSKKTEDGIGDRFGYDSETNETVIDLR